MGRIGTMVSTHIANPTNQLVSIQGANAPGAHLAVSATVSARMAAAMSRSRLRVWRATHTL